jgi:hypothetical protein
MADTEQEAQWRKAFEMIGPETLRLQLVDGLNLATDYKRLTPPDAHLRMHR